MPSSRCLVKERGGAGVVSVLAPGSVRWNFMEGREPGAGVLFCERRAPAATSNVKGSFRTQPLGVIAHRSPAVAPTGRDVTRYERCGSRTCRRGRVGGAHDVPADVLLLCRAGVHPHGAEGPAHRAASAPLRLPRPPEAPTGARPPLAHGTQGAPYVLADFDTEAAAPAIRSPQADLRLTRRRRRRP